MLSAPKMLFPTSTRPGQPSKGSPPKPGRILQFAGRWISCVVVYATQGAGETVTSPQASAKFLQLELASEEREVFAVLFLDTRRRMIAFEKLFWGAIDGASIHPRDVVKRGLQLRASWRTIIHQGWLIHPMQMSSSRRG